MEVNYTSYTGLCNFHRIIVWAAALALHSGAAQKKAGLPPPTHAFPFKLTLSLYMLTAPTASFSTHNDISSYISTVTVNLQPGFAVTESF